MTSREKMLGEMGKSMYALKYMKAEPSWDVQQPDVENLQDQANRIDDPETDAESEHSDHETESEQSADGDRSEDDDLSNCFIGRDNTTIWHANPPRKNVRTAAKNIVIHSPGVRAIACSANTPIDCWKLFFSDSMIETIVKCTNLYLDKLRTNYQRARDCRETDFAEIRALLGLLYMAGLKKAQHLNLKELWATDGTAPECFRAIMSRERFLLLLRALRFEKLDDRKVLKEQDNLAPIREIFEEFNAKCRENYHVGEYTTIDKMLEPFRGLCKFRQYLPSKPVKYGLKIYALVDSCTFYTSNLDIYAGRQPDGPFKVENSASAVVKRLADHILNTGRNITMDNYFTSISLAKELLEKRTTLVGTIRKNKREIPAQFIETRKKPLHSSLFGFIEDGVLVSYKTKRSGNVLAFSTFHSNDDIDENSGVLAKPEIITFYNLTKDSVDVVDEMKASYSVARVSCRWPLTIFFGIMNTGGINSQIIYKANTGNFVERRIFLKELALSLMKLHLITRSTIQNICTQDRENMKRIAGVEITIEKSNKKQKGEGFCAFCPRRKNKKTKKVCQNCNVPICPSHTMYSCQECAKSYQSHSGVTITSRPVANSSDAAPQCKEAKQTL